MSTPKKSAAGTGSRVVTELADIIMSIVLLLIICLPLVFVVPMWIQYTLLRVPASNLALNPLSLFGYLGAVAVMLGLSAASILIGYVYVIKTKPKTVPREKKKAMAAMEEEPEIEAETIAEEKEAAREPAEAEEQSGASELDEENEETEN
ncbi:MAG: hypothetical protein C4K47_05040 [Candidatus Thorarchaeota archaeon]|nr:MAG: hypothetical protein C4K47_05040 [Candidatus Thorarchaeota archaeon]